MRVQLTELDRRDLQRHAWSMVRSLPAPRHVRLLMRDKLVMDMIPRLIEAREAEQAELQRKWAP